MKTILVDTNAFLRLLLNDIPKQKKEVENILNKAKRNEVILLVAQIVVFEIDYSLEKYYKFPKEIVIERLRSLISSKYLQVETRDLFVSALELYSNANISFVDCFLLAKAEKEEAELFTFDQKLLLANRTGKRK